MPEKTEYNTDHKKKILDYLKRNGETSLSKIKSLDKAHQNITRNLRLLLKDKEIRVFLKINTDIIKAISLTDDEIFYSCINKYQYPQDIINLIDEMQSQDKEISKQAYDEFIKLYLNICLNHIKDKPHYNKLYKIKKTNAEELATKIISKKDSEFNAKIAYRMINPFWPMYSLTDKSTEELKEKGYIPFFDDKRIKIN